MNAATDPNRADRCPSLPRLRSASSTTFQRALEHFNFNEPVCHLAYRHLSRRARTHLRELNPFGKAIFGPWLAQRPSRAWPAILSHSESALFVRARRWAGCRCQRSKLVSSASDKIEELKKATNWYGHRLVFSAFGLQSRFMMSGYEQFHLELCAG